MSMTDCVSIETGKRLQKAGLRWQPQEGDWMITVDAPDPLLVVGVEGGEPQCHRYSHVIYDCTWLPSTGQLFALLKANHLCVETRYNNNDIVFVWCRELQGVTTVSQSAAEALAGVWLSLHAEKGGDAMGNGIRELTAQEARILFDHEARRSLNISGEEFIRAWDAGEFKDDPDRPEVIRLAMLLPFAR